jgi:hypothetical protein
MRIYTQNTFDTKSEIQTAFSETHAAEEFTIALNRPCCRRYAIISRQTVFRMITYDE